MLKHVIKLREAIAFRGFPSGSGVKSENEVKAKVAQSCLTLCNPMDYTVHGILQARILEWVAYPLVSPAFNSSTTGIRLPCWLTWQRICLQCRRPGFNPWVRKICWRRGRLPTLVFLGFPCGSAGKESTCNVEGWVQFLGWEDHLEKAKATYSSILA